MNDGRCAACGVTNNGDSRADGQPQPIGRACDCPASCETHTHLLTENTHEPYVLCWHDGETDHGHCPNA